MEKRPANPELIDRARSLRQNQTPAEICLWGHLRDRRIHDFKFRRQVTIGPYIVDFLCHEARLVVELDGSQHRDQAAYGMQRTRYLEKCGFHVLRYWNNEVMQNEEGVLEGIDARLIALTVPQSPSPSGRGCPKGG